MPLNTILRTNSEDVRDWDAYVAAHPRGTFVQLSSWSRVKASYGWKPALLIVMEDNELVGGAMVLRRTVGLGMSIDYVAYGPLWEAGRADVLSELLKAMQDYSVDSVALRLEPNLPKSGDESDTLIDSMKSLGFIPTAKSLQPDATLFLNTSSTEDDLMSGMRQTTRRYIRKAERQGVEVVVDTEGSKLEDFYTMLQRVNSRKQFGIHEKAYYQKVWDFFAQADNKKLVQPYILTVVKDGEVLGAYFLVRVGNKSWELYGGVTDQGMQSKANFLLKWKSILLMKKEGVTLYDQWGVAPLAPSVQGQEVGGKEQAEIDTKHSLAGVTYFKEGFGGERTQYMGCWDKPFNPVVYKIARLMKKL